MSYQDGIDNIGSKQGILDSIDPSYLSDQMQLMKEGCQGNQVIYESYVNQLPSVNNEPITIQFETDNVYRPGAGLCLVDNTNAPNLGEILPQVNGSIRGEIGMVINRTGGGQGVETLIWMEYFFPISAGGNDEWIRYGGLRELVSFQNQPIEIERKFSIARCNIGDRFRFRIGVADATEGIGLYAVPASSITVNVPPPATGLSADIASAELNMYVYDFGITPTP